MKKLFSAGLIWKYLGYEILTNILKSINLLEENRDYLEEMHKKYI